MTSFNELYNNINYHGLCQRYTVGCSDSGAVILSTLNKFRMQINILSRRMQKWQCHVKTNMCEVYCLIYKNYIEKIKHGIQQQLTMRILLEWEKFA